jgi:DNA damage-binding protein 1
LCTEYVVVGTSFLNPDETEPTSGRILTFSIDTVDATRKLVLASETAIKGGIITLGSIQGRIIAGINATVVVYAAFVSHSGQYAFTLHKVADYLGNVWVVQLVVSKDQNYVLVGDLMKVGNKPQFCLGHRL